MTNCNKEGLNEFSEQRSEYIFRPKTLDFIKEVAIRPCNVRNTLTSAIVASEPGQVS